MHEMRGIGSLIMCSNKKILALESRDLSQAEKEITAILIENSCHFVNLLSLASNNYDFLDLLKRGTPTDIYSLLR